MSGTEPTPAAAASSFASFLTRLAAPAADTVDTWNDDNLGDDVVTLSYEQALRTHSRVRPPSPPSLPDLDPPVSRHTAPAAVSAHAKTAAGPASPIPSLEESRKSSSVTIRMSQIECEQLRERAAKAGLTVSAYLRSCIFEVEALRSQVRETLVQLRSGTAPEPHAEPAKAKPEMQRAVAPARGWNLFSRLRWLFAPRLAASQRVAHA